LAMHIGNQNLPRSAPNPITNEYRHIQGITSLGNKWARAGFQFVPLVTEDYGQLRCNLDVLLLRPEDQEKKYIYSQGDIDAQLKTLFDALRIPDHLKEIGTSTMEPDEQPMFCLLSDDRLISEVSVACDRLLMLPQHKTVEATDAFVTIHVKINHVIGGGWDRWLD
jgi:hypothetical protein